MSVFFDVLPEDDYRSDAAPSLAVISGGLPRLSSTQFAILWSVLAGFGVALLVFVHLQLSQGEYEEASLRQELRISSEQVHDLQTTLLALTSTKSLRDKGLEFKMLPAANAVGINLSTGDVLGQPKAAPSAQNSGSSSAGTDTSSGAWRTNDGAVLVSKG